MVEVKDVISMLEELHEDNTIPKNVKTKIENTMKILMEKTDISIRVNKALHELEEIADDTNMQPYTRTQIWNIVSMLEKL